MLKKSSKGYYFWEEFSKNGIVNGVSTRHFGSIVDNKKIQIENLKKFLDVFSIYINHTVFLGQTHSSNVAIVDNLDQKIILNTDGAITSKKNIFLCIVTADCLPVIFYDEKMDIVGIAHAGYKGLLKGILKNMVLGFRKLGSDSKNILVAIGPSIGVCCYDVPYDRVQMFVKSNGDSGQARMTNQYQLRNGKYFLDLKNIAKQSLISDGILKNNIEVSDICTKDNIKDFFSFRGEGPKNFGEFATIVGKV